MGDGETPEEAIEDVQEAFKAFLKDAIKNNDEIALPTIGVSMK
jgi:predicted RNase H-like HicB family nuclease